jgi:hypothetical protein
MKLGGKLSAVLRASGPDFDVNAFVANCGLNVSKVFYRGEPLLPDTRPGGRRHADSGLNLVVSNAEFHEFAEQIEDAIDFLKLHAVEVQRLAAFPGVTGVVLDFGIECRDVVAQSDQFPAELVRLAGTCGIALEMSHYRVSDAESAAG